MKPESRGSILNRSFRRSFRKKKPEDATDKAEEERLLYEFRKAVEDVDRPLHKDSDLKRFLQARDYDIEEADKLFRLDASYRKLLDIDNISDYEMPEVNIKYNITGLLGCDKEGSPVRVLNLGTCDFKGFTQALCTTELVKIFLWFMTYDMKYLDEQNKKFNRNVEDFLYIVNLENFSMTQLMYKPVIDVAFVALKLLQDHFFDAQKAIIVVNAPSFYSAGYKLFKPVLTEMLDKKMKVYSSNDDNWKKDLLNRIDADILPQYLGGNRVGPIDDPRCSDIIGFGGLIPSHYFPSKESYLDPSDPEVTAITIAAGSFANVPISVDEAGTIMEWHVESKDMDLAIGLYYEPLHATLEEPIRTKKGSETPKNKRKNAETPKLRRKMELLSKLEPLSPILRCTCHIIPEIGSMVCWKPGLHVVHFDNSYSWLSSKQVLYKFTLKPPKKKSGASLTNRTN